MSDNPISFLVGNVPTPVSATNPMPVTGGGGGGGGGGDASAANQVTGNTSLATIATSMGTETTNTGAISTNLGAQADTAAASDTSNASLIAFMKRMVAKLPGLGAKVSSAAMAVVIASDQPAIAVNADPPQVLAQPTANTMAALNATVAWAVEGGGGFLISLTNPAGTTAQFVGTVTFQSSIDGGSSWQSLSVIPQSSNTAQTVTTSTTVGLWLANLPNAANVQVRANMTAYTSGTVAADLVAVGQPGGIINLPWSYTVTSGQTVVPAINLSGIAEVYIQIANITTTVLQPQGTNDPAAATWDNLGAILVTGAGSPIVQIAGVATYRTNVAGYKFFRLQCTTTGTVLNIAGISARLGAPQSPVSALNVAQFNGAQIVPTTAQVGINVVQLGGTVAAASVANGSTNKVLAASQATAVSQTDVSAVAFAGTGSVLGTVIASAQGGGGVVSAEINVSALTLGAATGVIMILQESTGGTNFTDIWCSDIFTTTGIQRMPAMPVAGRRRWRAFNVGGASTTVTVTVTTLELPTGSFPLMRQFRDLYAAATPFATMVNSAAQTATNMVLATVNTFSSVWNIEGCKALTAFATFVAGTPTTAPVLTVQFSMDGTNWWTSANTFTPTAAGVFGVSFTNTAWKYARLLVSTAQVGGTNYTLGAVGINGVN
jgi:hypothetical protein